jgi:hypothetical protein
MAKRKPKPKPAASRVLRQLKAAMIDAHRAWFTSNEEAWGPPGPLRCAWRDASDAALGARAAVRGLTDPEARIVALMTCENAKVRTAALLATAEVA